MVDDDEAPAGMGLHEAGSLGTGGGLGGDSRYADRGSRAERFEQRRPVEARVLGPCHDGDRCRSHTVATRSPAASAKKIPASIAWNVQN